MICLIPLVGDPKIGSPPVRVCLGFLGCTWFDRSYLMIALLGTNISYISQGGIMLVPWRIYKKTRRSAHFRNANLGQKKREEKENLQAPWHQDISTSTLPKFKQFASKSELTLWKQLSCLDISGFFLGWKKGTSILMSKFASFSWWTSGSASFSWLKIEVSWAKRATNFHHVLPFRCFLVTTFLAHLQICKGHRPSGRFRCRQKAVEENHLQSAVGEPLVINGGTWGNDRKSMSKVITF